MSAVLKESAVPSHVELTGVFDVAGQRVERYASPEIEIHCDDFYGSITGKFEPRPREKLLALLDNESIAIHFDKFTDGRPYTLAHRLRELGYVGELHAVGNINQELIHHLRRVGFTHFHLLGPATHHLDHSVLYPFGGHYQRTAIESVNRHGETVDTDFNMFAID